MLAALESELCLGLALCALESQNDLLGGLCLLVEDRLGLTTVTGLLTVVTTLTLGEEGGLNDREWYEFPRGAFGTMTAHVRC